MLKAISDELDKIQSAGKPTTFSESTCGYVDMKRNVLSPRTVKEYTETGSRLPDWFKELQVSDITQSEINRFVNELPKGQKMLQFLILFYNFVL